MALIARGPSAENGKRDTWKSSKAATAGYSFLERSRDAMQEHDKTNDEDHSQEGAQEQSAFAHNAEQPQQTGQETGGQIAGETPPSTSAQQPASQAGPNTTKQFWQGIAWGAIPLVVFLISYVAALQPNESRLGFALLA